MRRRTDEPSLREGLPLRRAEALFPFRRGSPGRPHRIDPGGPISTELRINDRIRVPEVRLVGPNGETVGIVRIDEALRAGRRRPTSTSSRSPRRARPPVCKLMDYGKFKYENAQKAREARRNQTNTVIKEMKLRPKIDPHDYETKKGHVVRFLQAGRQGQDHDHVPRSRAAPPRARVPAAAAAGRGRHGARLRRVVAEAGRPQHDHGARPAQEEGRGQGRGEGREGRAGRRPRGRARPRSTPRQGGRTRGPPRRRRSADAPRTSTPRSSADSDEPLRASRQEETDTDAEEQDALRCQASASG